MMSFLARLANSRPCRLKGPSKLVLNSPVIPMKWEHPSIGAPVLVPDTAQSIIDLYATSHRIPVVALSEEYFVPFPNYLDNKSY